MNASRPADLLLLKGTGTAFAGLASLPVIHDLLVVQHHVLTDQQLNEAVVITRSTPGPVGLYIVSVGYFCGRASWRGRRLARHDYPGRCWLSRSFIIPGST